jgi:hypothetical protein
LSNSPDCSFSRSSAMLGTPSHRPRYAPGLKTESVFNRSDSEFGMRRTARRNEKAAGLSTSGLQCARRAWSLGRLALTFVGSSIL